MKKYNRIWMIIMSMLLLFCQPLTVSATEPSAEQESETEEDEGDLQDEIGRASCRERVSRCV